MTKLKGSIMSADTSQVRVVCSDSEYSGIKNCRFPRKRIKPNILSNSNNELNFFENSLVSPSSGEAGKQNTADLSSQQRLWNASSSINFLLMDKDLVALCEETIEELKNGVSSHNSMQSLILTCPEFIMRFNKLHDDLHSMLVVAQCQNPKVLSQNKYQPELQSLQSECKLLREQASMLELRFPHMKEDISKRVNILTNKLKAVNRLLNCKRHSPRDGKHKNLSMQMKAMRKWLRHVTNDLRSLIVGNDFSLEQIEEVFTQQKILQREIESRGREVTSLVRQCGSTDGATVAGSPRWKVLHRLRRAAANVERTWHNVWIRSLETQCHTEQLLRQREGAGDKAQVIRESTESDIDEEPLTKHRRLARDHWTSSIMSRLPDRIAAKRPEDLLHAMASSKSSGGHGPAVNVSDKGIMVGTTGIAALKAEYGDDFSKLEIIQDVGYSSESSTHLSGDDTVYFYSYHPSNSEHRTVIATSAGATLSLKDELDNALFVSNLLQDEIPEEDGYLDDSGFAGPATPNPAGEGPDHLETVIDAVCLDFSEDHHRADDEDVELVTGGAAIDEPTGTFHNRTSFTTSAQKFYKMISVDSDNGEHDPGATDNCDKTTDAGNSSDFKQFTGFSQLKPGTDSLIVNKQDSPEDATWDTYNWTLASSPPLCSTPIRPSFGQPNLKRKRPTPVSSSTALLSSCRSTAEYRPGRVSAWLRHHEDDWDDPLLGLDRRASSSSSPFGLLSSSCHSREDDSSSCDASFEYTSSSSPSSSDECCFSCDLSDDCCGGRAASAAIPIATRRASRRSPLKIPHQRGGSGQLPQLLLPPPPPLSPLDHRSRDVDFVPAAKASFPVSEGFCPVPACGETLGVPTTRECFSDLDNLKDSASRWSTKDTLSKSLSQDHIPNRPGVQPGTLSSLPCLLPRPRSYEELATLLSKRASSTPSTSSNPSPLHQRSSNNRNFNGNSSSTYCCSETGHKKRQQRSRKKSCSSFGKSKRGCSTSEVSADGHHVLLSNSSMVTPEMRDRRRHFSELQVPAGINSGDGLHCLETEAAKLPLLEDNDQECHGTQLLMERPAASPSVLSLADAVLTQLEEQSIVSDQLWDDYQALPYLSEAYSEATVDEDAVRKLTEFGDDYVSAIGQLPSRLDLPDDGSRTSVDGGEHVAKPRSRKSQKSSKVSVSQRSSRHFDSDSDLEDLHNVLKDTHEALDFAKATLNRRQTEGHLHSADYTDLLATCKTHLNYLQTILEHGVEKGLSSKDSDELYDLIQEWELIKRCTVMYEKGQSHLQQKNLKLRDNIESLFLDLSECSGTKIDTNKLGSLDELKRGIIQLQVTLSTLQETKDKLRDVSVQVHHFVTEHGENPNDREFCLKDKVTELYEEWDDTVQLIRSHRTELQGLSDRLECFVLKVEKLQSELPPSDVANCDNSRLTKQLTDLQGDVEYLETHLKGGALWKTLEDDFLDLVDCLTSPDKDERFQSRRRTTDSLSNLLRSATHPNSSTTVDYDADNKLHDAIVPDEGGTPAPPPQPADDYDDDFVAKGSGNWFWRVFRAAVPIQLAIVLLYCLACYLEPHCCDVLNNFNFSLHPQLRYPRGPPPV